jgi:ribosomal protein S18 acetylase RimI-like enzyme
VFKTLQIQKKTCLKEIQIKYDKNVPPEFVQQLYISVGWQHRDCFQIRKALEGSFLVVSAWLDERLIGLARATGDGVFSVTIWDFAIKPSHQKQGIGKLLLNSMLTKLNDYDIPLITLYSELDKKSFYSKLGFECGSQKIIGMYKYNK